MIICPNCAHSNPDGAVNCEACFTPLPIIKNILCPSCNTSMLSDAKFCGHCGFNLSDKTAVNYIQNLDQNPSQNLNTETGAINLLVNPFTPITENFLVLPNLNTMSNPSPIEKPEEKSEENTNGSIVTSSTSEASTSPKVAEMEELLEGEPTNESASESANESISTPAITPISVNAKTQLQQFSASLLHVQTNLTIEIPAHLPVVHIGKPNTVIPPDIDVSGFPDSDIVSRIHADIRDEGGFFYFEDTGSSNGTYINNLPLPAGNRHKLRAGDRICLGKGDKVSFVFQLS